MTTPQTSPAPVVALCHCGHTEDEHDVVAARYCRATLSNVLRRGCTCHPEEEKAPRVYDRR